MPKDRERHRESPLPQTHHRWSPQRRAPHRYALVRSHQGKIYVSTDDFQRRDWCRNVLACSDVRVLVGGTELKGTARPVDNPAQRDEIKRLSYERYNGAFMGMAKQFVEISPLDT